jgi:hypothetical protein
MRPIISPCDGELAMKERQSLSFTLQSCLSPEFGQLEGIGHGQGHNLSGR